MIILKPRLNQILIFSISLLASMGLIIFIITIIVERPEDLKRLDAIIAYLLFIIVFGPPLIMSITYFYNDLTKKVIIDKLNNQILIRKKGIEQIITNKDIMGAFYVRVGDYNGTRYRFPSYKYLMIVLKERKRICITNLLCEPDEIIKVLKLNPSIIETNVPLINWSFGSSILTSKEFESKVVEFEKNFDDYSNSKLIDIIKQKNVYADYAREAASRILKKRKQNSNVTIDG